LQLSRREHPSTPRNKRSRSSPEKRGTAAEKNSRGCRDRPSVPASACASAGLARLVVHWHDPIIRITTPQFVKHFFQAVAWAVGRPFGRWELLLRLVVRRFWFRFHRWSFLADIPVDAFALRCRAEVGDDIVGPHRSQIGFQMFNRSVLRFLTYEALL